MSLCSLFNATERRSIVYLLTNRDQKRTYIGWTNQGMAHRLAQHNGILSGGAKYTSRFGRPWIPVACVIGFSSATGARQFEWASKRAAGVTARIQQMVRLLLCPHRTTKAYTHDQLVLLVHDTFFV